MDRNGITIDSKKRKAAARRTAKNALVAIPDERRALAAQRACAHLTAVIAWREARCILAYLAVGPELDADPVLEAALAEGKAAYVPRIDDGEMEFRRLANLSGPFESGHFGIRQPQTSEPLWNPLSVPGPTLVLVPGLAFDSGGRRLGRGGGYYDRFLSRIRREAAAAGEVPPVCLGYGYAEQISEEVPTDTDDERLDGAATDIGVIFAS